MKTPLLQRLFKSKSSRLYVVPYMSFWAKRVLKRHKPKIIGITGTVGKTTLTQMLAHVLGQEGARDIVGIVGATRGNQNGDRGLPASILDVSLRGDSKDFAKTLAWLPWRALSQMRSKNYPRLLVLEYGTFDGGHLHNLTKVAAPDIAIVTTIGPGHLERLKTVKGVYQEKRAVVLAAPGDGLVVLGSGHEFVDRLRTDSRAPVVIAEGRGIELAENITRIVATHLGLPKQLIEKGLKSYKPPAGRQSRFKAGDITVIDDSYNANPLSMKLGLDLLAEDKNASRAVAVLGAMAELGDRSSDYHREIGAYAKERGITVIGVGDAARDYAPAHCFSNSVAAASNIREQLEPGDLVLIKGSHSANLKVVANALRPAKDSTVDAQTGDQSANCSTCTIDATTGAVLSSYELHRSVHPWSLTKVALSILVCRSGLDLDGTTITLQQQDIVRGSGAGLQADDELSLREAILAMAIASDNNAATAAGRHMGRRLEPGGNEPIARAVRELNALAAREGWSNTTFTSCSGLRLGARTDALDMVRMFQLAISYEVLRTSFSLPRHTLTVRGPSARTIPIVNTNDLLVAGEMGILGGKTGAAPGGGSAQANLVFWWKSAEGKERISCVLGSSRRRRFIEAKELMLTAR